jgi:hypothetical protein
VFARCACLHSILVIACRLPLAAHIIAPLLSSATRGAASTTFPATFFARALAPVASQQLSECLRQILSRSSGNNGDARA